MSLITTLNRRLIRKAFELLVPEKLNSQVCLLVLGSEGRYLDSNRQARVVAHNIESGVRRRPFKSVSAGLGVTTVDLGGSAAAWYGRFWWQSRALAARQSRSHAKWLALVERYAPER